MQTLQIIKVIIVYVVSIYLILGIAFTFLRMFSGHGFSWTTIFKWAVMDDILNF